VGDAITIKGGAVLAGDGFVDADLALAGGLVAPSGGPAGRVLDASGLRVLPGIVDIHGDAFERQIMPRPGVMIDLDVALLETDRQLVANGITTAYHGVTWSWEPGLRGPENAAAILVALERLAPRLAADTRYHLRHETFNLDAEPVILDWIAKGRLGCIAFNDHMAGTIKQRHRPDKMRKMIERSGLTEEDFHRLVEEVHGRADEVEGSIARLARAAVAADVPALSHDDMSPDMRAWFRDLGVTVAEFPIDEPTTAAASAAGDPIVFGAPNVLRGGSHTGCPSAAEMVAREMCTVLASDYYYPALPIAPVKLARERGVDFARAWALVSSGPADALGLRDRGRLVPGLRADVVLLDERGDGPPRVVATIVAGRIAHLCEAERLGAA
jgi:alpha-D-ribose 1-methylphosphonate 5-triphosphate diphosphatase